MIRKIVLSLIAVLSLCSLALAQNRQVAGTVTDAQGEPIIGASVVVAGTTIGTSTNASGKYTIMAPANGTLEVSYVGYEDVKTPIAGKTTVDVAMKESSIVTDDVVVMGYGSGKKVGTVIGSVDKVKAEKLENRASNNVVDALQGQVAGLTIMTDNGELNTASTIRIHGVGSINATSEPLILLDGAPVSSSTLLAINQNDIEAINVLKDASATSIYGSRAANGVIYVATKKGRLGQEGVNVTLRAQYSMSSIPTPKMKRMDTDTYLNYQGALGAAAKGLDYTDPAYIEIYREKFISDFKVNPETNINWFDEIMKKSAPMYQVDLSVSGGSAKTSYFFSGNYSDQTGVMPGSALTRYTFRSNVDTRATDWLKMGMNLSVGYTDSTQASTADSQGELYTTNPLFASYFIPSFQPLYQENGTTMREWLDYYGDANPLLSPVYFPQGSNRLQLNGSAFVEITPIKGLTIRSMLSATGFDYRSTSGYSPLRATANGPEGIGNVIEGFQRSYSWTISNTVEYKFSVKDQHNLAFLVGQEGLYNSSEAMSAGSTGITNARFMYLSMGTESVGIPAYSASRSAFNSWFGRAEYNYNEKYFVDISLRDDASSRFPKNNRHAFFWSAGAMWNIKNEGFLKESMTVSDLSLKVSYGTQGNAGIGDFSYMQMLGVSNFPYNGIVGWNIGNIGNPDLKWEQQNILTVGVSTRLWNKLGLDVEFYRRETTDMLMDKPLALSAGYSSVLTNVGAMTNTGVDITLNYDIFANKDWFVNFHTTFNYNKNKLTKLWDETTTEAPLGDFMYYIKGGLYPTYVVQEWRGVDSETGYPQWTAAGGGITNNFNEAVLINQGTSPYAPYTGGFGVTASWKGIALTADFSWVAGNALVNNNLFFFANTIMAEGGSGQIMEVLDYWKEPGDNAKYPNLEYAMDRTKTGETQFDSRMLEDGSFLRLKNVQLSYTLPTHIIQKTRFIKGLKVYIGARNLWTVTGYSGFDPEGAENVFDADVYPNTRQWTFGAEFKF